MGSGSLLRNVCLIALAIAGFELSRIQTSPLPNPSFEFLVVVSCLLVLSFLLIALRPAREALLLTEKDVEAFHEQVYSSGSSVKG